MLTPWKKSYDEPRQHIKKQRHYFFDRGPYSQSYGFSNSHVWMWELDHKGGWTLKNWCFWTVVMGKTLESPLESKEVKPVNPKGNQPWIFIRRMDAEALIFWRPDAKSWLTGKDPDAGKCWRQEENGMTQDEMVGWHHQQEGHEFEQAPGDDEGQGSLAGCSPWGHKESIWLSNKSKRNHFEKAMYYSDSNCENNTVETTKRSVIVRDVWGGREGYTEAYRILEQLKLFSMIS